MVNNTIPEPVTTYGNGPPVDNEVVEPEKTQDKVFNSMSSHCTPDNF